MVAAFGSVLLFAFGFIMTVRALHLVDYVGRIADALERLADK